MDAKCLWHHCRWAQGKGVKKMESNDFPTGLGIIAGLAILGGCITAGLIVAGALIAVGLAW